MEAASMHSDTLSRLHCMQRHASFSGSQLHGGCLGCEFPLLQQQHRATVPALPTDSRQHQRPFSPAVCCLLAASTLAQFCRHVAAPAALPAEPAGLAAARGQDLQDAIQIFKAHWHVALQRQPVRMGVLENSSPRGNSVTAAAASA